VSEQLALATVRAQVLLVRRYFGYCDPPTVIEVLGFRTRAQLPVPL